MVAAFNSIGDGIGRTQELLTMVCVADALNAGIDVRNTAREPLRLFFWQRMFPRIATPERVAVTAVVKQEMDQRLTPKIVGA
jgi:hypothetical protein